MGQHSSPSEWHFYRSVVMWFLPWVVIAGVIGVAVWIGVDALSGGGGDNVVVAPSPTKSAAASPSPSPSPSADKAEASPSPSETKKPDPTKTPDPDRELITEGISVQVLNATAAAGAEDEMAERLTDLGFEVVATEQASASYQRTTVFWSFAESERAAKALAARFGWLAKAKPENLSATVDMHVVVGQDEV